MGTKLAPDIHALKQSILTVGFPLTLDEVPYHNDSEIFES